MRRFWILIAAMIAACAAWGSWTTSDDLVRRDAEVLDRCWEDEPCWRDRPGGCTTDLDCGATEFMGR